MSKVLIPSKIIGLICLNFLWDRFCFKFLWGNQWLGIKLLLKFRYLSRTLINITFFSFENLIVDNGFTASKIVMGDPNTPFPTNIVIAIRYSIFVKGDQTNFEIGLDGVVGTQCSMMWNTPWSMNTSTNFGELCKDIFNRMLNWIECFNKLLLDSSFNKCFSRVLPNFGLSKLRFLYSSVRLESFLYGLVILELCIGIFLEYFCSIRS